MHRILHGVGDKFWFSREFLKAGYGEEFARDNFNHLHYTRQVGGYSIHQLGQQYTYKPKFIPVPWWRILWARLTRSM